MEPLVGIILIAFIVWRYSAKSNKSSFHDIAIRSELTSSEVETNKYIENNLTENQSKNEDWKGFDFLRYEQRIEVRLRKVLEREKDALSILTFVCRADGRMMPAERAIISGYLKRRCRDILNKEDNITEAIKALVTPEYRDYKKAVTTIKLSGDIDRLRDITDCAKRIVATQKTIDPLEKASIEVLENAINSKIPIQKSATT